MLNPGYGRPMVPAVRTPATSREHPMRNRAIVAGTVIIGITGVTATPANASTPLPNQPCVLSIPAKVNIGAPVTATIGACPEGALAGSVYWNLDGPQNDTLNFSYDGSALYPRAGLTNEYGPFHPGSYQIGATESTTFCDSDYSNCYEIPLYANTVTAKYRTSTTLQVSRSTSGTRRTSRITVTVNRYDRYGSDQVAAATVTIYRDGKALTTIKTASNGTGTKTINDTKGTHTYKASTNESSSTWTSTSASARK